METAWKSLLQRRLASKTDRAQTSENIDDKYSASDTGNSLGKSEAASVLPRTSDNVPQNTDVSRAFHQNKHEIHHPLESEVYTLSFDRITELRTAASVRVKYGPLGFLYTYLLSTRCSVTRRGRWSPAAPHWWQQAITSGRRLLMLLTLAATVRSVENTQRDHNV